MKYFKLFSHHSDYELYINNNPLLPNLSHCKDVKDCHFNPYIEPYNGYEYADLGLPSNKKWAKMNIGAQTETDIGMFFQWADTQGYTSEQVGSGADKKYFYWTDYKYGSDIMNMLKYNETDDLTVIELSDDAARVNWGGLWRVPTITEWQELVNNTTATWETINGVNGVKFTGQNNNYIFIPYSGDAETGSIHTGWSPLWSSDIYINEDSYNGARNISISYYNNNLTIYAEDYQSRYRGFHLRAIVG